MALDNLGTSGDLGRACWPTMKPYNSGPVGHGMMCASRLQNTCLVGNDPKVFSAGP